LEKLGFKITFIAPFMKKNDIQNSKFKYHSLGFKKLFFYFLVGVIDVRNSY